MIVFLNGEFIPEHEARVSILDRGFLYGDGLFETLRACGGKLFRWQAHWERLDQGLAFVGIRAPYSSEQLLDFAEQLLARNNLREAALRLTLSRGVGGRAYSPAGAENPTLTMTLRPLPLLQPNRLDGWNLITSSFRLAGNALARFKTCNKLPQILARAEAEAAGTDEALLLNTEGHVVEAASGNLFWIENKTVCTPALDSGILPGVTRSVILQLCEQLGVRTRIGEITPGQLQASEGAFLSFSSVGIVEAVRVDNRLLARSPLTERLHASLIKLMLRECGP